jgi:hypothetical protein
MVPVKTAENGQVICLKQPQNEFERSLNRKIAIEFYTQHSGNFWHLG